MRLPTDSKGVPLSRGDQVRWRGTTYTVRGFQTDFPGAGFILPYMVDLEGGDEAPETELDRIGPPCVMTMYTVYHQPADCPDGFCVRAWMIRPGVDQPSCGEAVGPFESIEEARKAIPEGLSCLSRSPDDDPVIVETWL